LLPARHFNSEPLIFGICDTVAVDSSVRRLVHDGQSNIGRGGIEDESIIKLARPRSSVEASPMARKQAYPDTRQVLSDSIVPSRIMLANELNGLLNLGYRLRPDAANPEAVDSMPGRQPELEPVCDGWRRRFMTRIHSSAVRAAYRPPDELVVRRSGHNRGLGCFSDLRTESSVRRVKNVDRYYGGEEANDENHDDNFH
jgi:hypothetical protein